MSWIMSTLFGADEGKNIPKKRKGNNNETKKLVGAPESENDSFEFTSTERARSLLKTQNLDLSSSSESESDSSSGEENSKDLEQVMSQTEDLLNHCLKESKKIYKTIKTTSHIDEIKYRSFKQAIHKILNSLDAIEVSEVPKLRPKIREAVKTAKSTDSFLESVNNVQGTTKNIHSASMSEAPMLQTQGQEKQSQEVSLMELLSQDSELQFLRSNFTHLDVTPDHMQEGATCQEFGIRKHGYSAKRMSAVSVQGKAAASPTEPIQLLVPLQNGTYVMNEVALRQLLYREDMRHRKVVPVTVVGGMRQGKSFLLNVMRRYLAAQGRGTQAADNWLKSEDLNSLKGFEWQTGRDLLKAPNILLWPEPFFINDDLAVLLLDTQVSPSHDDASVFINTFIFKLSTMLSAVQIYNMSEVIQMDDFLSVKELLEFGKLMMAACDEKAFQNLIILVRDWKCPDNKPFGVAGGQSLINEWKKSAEGSSNHEISELLTLCFDTIWCYLLPHPGDHVAKNPNFKGALADMPLDFQQMLVCFVEKTLDKRKLLPKRNGRNEIIAQDFLQYSRMCVEQLQKIEITAQSILEETAGVELSKLKETCIEFYEKEMREKMPIFEIIDDLHRESVKGALELYDSMKKFGGVDVSNRYREAILQFTQHFYENKVKKFIEVRETERQEMIEKSFRAAKRQFKKKMTMFLSQDNFEMTLAEHHNLLRKGAIKYFIHETKSKISEVQLVEYIEKLDKRMKETCENYVDEYDSKCAAVIAMKQDKECKKAVASSLEQYCSTMSAACGGDKICEDIESIHQRAKNRAVENIKKLCAKYLDKHVVETHATNLIGAIGQEYKKFLESYTRKIDLKQQQEANELEGLKTCAETMYHDMLTSQGGMDLADKNKLKQLHEKSLESIQKDVFDSISAKFGAVKCKPFIKAAKQALKSHYQAYKSICATNQCFNVLLDTYKCDIQRLNATIISSANLKKQNEKLKSEICSIFQDQCNNGSNFQAKFCDLPKELDKIFQIFQQKKENSVAALKTKHEEETCKTASQFFKKKVVHLDVGKSYVPDLESKLDEVLSETRVEFNKLWQGSEDSSKAKWEELYQYFRKECCRLIEVNNKMEPPKDEYAIALKEGLKKYNSEMNEVFLMNHLPEMENLSIYNTTAVRAALQSFKNSPKKLKITKKMETEFLIDLENLFEKFKMNFSLKLRQKRMNEDSNNSGKSYAIGIDLGTTYSCATVYKNGKVELILNKEKRHTTPSVVYIDNMDIVVGEAAQHKGFIDPYNCISEVKRLIGRTYKDPVVQELKKIFAYTIVNENDRPVIKTTKNSTKKWQAEEISAEVLKELKHNAEVHLNSTVHDAVVTIPAYFTEPQRSATMQACKLAGLNVLRLLNEPTAAAITYGMDNMSDEERHVLVFDFGGGTCDISILKVKSGNFIVKASNGDNKLGGEDFDDRLMEFVVAKIESQEEKKFDRTARRRLRFKCEIAKCRLTDSPEYTISLVECFDGEDIDFSVKRKDFEEICRDLFERALEPVKLCLQEAGLEKKDIDEVVLAGGSSRVPKIRQMLTAFFGNKTLNCSINPDEAIANGAALEAARLTGECQTDIRVLEITPFSLGVGVEDNSVSVLIAKNSQIPCTNTERFTTTSNYQRALEVCVYQGENFTNKHKNTLLGKFTLGNIRLSRAGMTAADVTFEIDTNGILKVTAEEVTSGRKENTSSLVITKNVCA